MPDYIPKGDAAFDTWIAQFDTAFAAVAGTLGFDPGDIAAVNSVKNTWQTSYQTYIAVRNLAQGARAGKDNDRQNAERLIRSYVRQIQANPTTTDEIRGQLGIAIPRSSKTLTGVPTESPRIQLDWSQRGQITVYTGSAPGKVVGNKFPAFAKAVLIQWRFPNGAWQLLTVTNKKSFVHQVGNTEPVTLEYRAAYLNIAGGQGPWSETDVATVAPVELQLASSQAA